MLTKHFIEIQGNMLNAFGIILFYKVVWWFDSHNISLEKKRLRFNAPYQYILRGVCIFVYMPCTYMCVNL